MEPTPSPPKVAPVRRSSSSRAARTQRQRPQSWSSPPTPAISEAPSPPPRRWSTTPSIRPQSQISPDVIEQQEQTGLALYSLVDIPRKGKGLIANRLIKPGTPIFLEAPLFIQPASLRPSNSSILGILALRTREEQTEYFKLTNTAGLKNLPALGIFETNALPCGGEGEATQTGKGEQRGLFLLASRVNHSCAPNVVHAWDAAAQCMIVRAIRPIAAREELCVAYGALLGTRAARQAWLNERWGFTCACEVCELQGPASEESDRRRESIARLYEEVGKCLKEPTLGIRKAKIALRLLKEENLVHYEASFCFDAFQFCVLVSDFGNAKTWVRRAWEASCNTFGPDSAAAHTFKMYWANPRAHRFAGMMPALVLSGPE